MSKQVPQVHHIDLGNLDTCKETTHSNKVSKQQHCTSAKPNRNQLLTSKPPFSLHSRCFTLKVSSGTSAAPIHPCILYLGYHFELLLTYSVSQIGHFSSKRQLNHIPSTLTKGLAELLQLIGSCLAPISKATFCQFVECCQPALTWD